MSTGRSVLLVLTIAMVFPAGCAAARGRQGQPEAAGMLWLVFVDDLHLDFRNTGRIRDVLRTAAKSLLQTGDLVAARSTGPSQVSLDATADHSAFTRVIPRVTGNGLRADDIIRVAGEPPIQSRDREGRPIFVNEVRYRASLALNGACDALREMRRVPARRRAMIYISNGYVAEGDGRGACERPQAVTRIARQSRVQIFSIDPGVLVKGLPSEIGVDADVWGQHVTKTQRSLRLLTGGTSGLSSLEPGYLRAWLQDVSARARR